MIIHVSVKLDQNSMVQSEYAFYIQAALLSTIIFIIRLILLLVCSK